MKFAIIGLGNHAINRVMPAISATGNSISAIYSRNLEKADQQSKIYGSSSFNDLGKLFKEGDFESVYISSPNFLHYRQAMDALHNGKHVLLEKQMTLSTEEAEKLVAESGKLGLNLSVGFHMRFHPAVREIRDMVQDGSMGSITFISGIWGALAAGGSRSTDREWWDDPDKSGGGSVMGTGVHVIDTVNFILGRGPDSVSCFKVPDRVVEDTFLMTAKYSGTVVSVVSSRAMKNPRNDLLVSGTGNTISVSDIFGTVVESKMTGPEGMVMKHYSGIKLYEEEIKSFVRSCSGIDEVIASGKDGLSVVRIVNAAFESSSTGLTVHLK